MLIILTGGGSGGHIFPLIAVTKELKILARERGIEDLDFLYVGPRFDTIVEEVFKREGIERRYILASKIRRYVTVLHLVDIVKFPFSIIQALWILFWNMPDAVFSKGGYGSFPVMLASWIFIIPSRVIHESDSAPGIANKLAAHFAKRIGVAFSCAALKFPVEKTAVVGLPVRDDLCSQDLKKARIFFDIQSDRKVVLVIGGSQGAKKINNAIIQSLPRLLAKYEIIHIVGTLNYDDAKKETESVTKSPLGFYYHLYPFLTEEMKLAFSLANIVITRGGASSIFEIASCQKPSIIVPLPGSAQDHQRKNAYEYAKSGATIVMEEDNMTPNLLFSNIAAILDDPVIAAKMSSNASTFSEKNSAKIIAKEILQLRGVI